LILDRRFFNLGRVIELSRLMTKKIEIAPKTIILTLALISIAAIIFIVRDLILLFFVSYIFFASLSPLVRRLTKRKIPHLLAVGLVVLGLILFLALFLFVGILPIVAQLRDFIDSLIAVINQISQTTLGDFINVSLIEREIRGLASGLFGLIVGFFQNLLLIFTVIVFTVYLLAERGRYERFISFLVGQPWEKTIFARIESRLGSWVRAEVLAGVVVGFLYFIALTALGIPFAPSLAVLGAIFEFVPIFGPFLAAAPAVLLALAVSPSRTLMVALAYLIIQEIEGHLIVPLVVGGTIGLDPLLVILSVVFFGRLFGFGGVFLAVPITVVIQIVFEEIISRNKHKLPSWLKS